MLEVIIAQYGLLAVFIGTFLEGEIVVVAGGFLSRLDFLSLPTVFATALVATFLGDQFFFYLGRKKGTAFLEKKHRLHWKQRADKIHDLIHNHQNKVLFCYRFLYGMRIPTLFAIGTSELPTRKFVLLNIINSVVWTTLFVLGGYYFGEFFTLLLGNVRAYVHEILMGLGILALVIWVVSFIKNRIEYN